MSEEQGEKRLDSTEQFREIRDTYMDVWAKAMGELVNTEAYAKQSGATLDAYLAASQPFRASLEKAMVNALQQFSMPTRPDFISLAERLTNLEMRLDDMDAKLDRIESAVTKSAASSSNSEAPKPVAEREPSAHQIPEPAAKVEPAPSTGAPRATHASRKSKKKGGR
ncbi:MAG TPA: hypothetical protein VM578_05040 [Candidatus Saccharimonadales bacterium]|nr:hypothetical protein [Candidatus Saccharimonadales bacterium]